MRHGCDSGYSGVTYLPLRALMLVMTVLIPLNVFGVEVKQVIDFGEIETSAGIVRIDQIWFQDESWNNRVFLGRNVIFEDKENEGPISIEATYSLGAKRGDLILLGITQGGSACPMDLRVLEVRVEGGYRISPEFGNCLPPADPKYFPNLKKNPVYRDGEWHIALPVPGSDNKEVVWYVYRDGRITKDRKKSK